MRIACRAALLAGSLGASQIVLAQPQRTDARPLPRLQARHRRRMPHPRMARRHPPRRAQAKLRPPCRWPRPNRHTPMKQMTVSDLTDKDLVGARDNEVGEIERVVESTADKKQHLVISRGGLLGLFETEVLVSLENVAVQGDRIVLRNLTEEQVKALPKYTRDDKAYRELDDSQSVSLSEQK